VTVRDTNPELADSSVLLAQRAPLPVELRVFGRRDWAAVGIVAAVLIGVVLRFVSRGPLWLDEAQSVAIAKQPLDAIAAALRHDGAPPLFYYLLHGWIKLFGYSPFSVRAMSGLPAVAALPVIVRLGRRIGGEAVGIASIVLLAVSPFAVRYAVEARMYSLMLLLALIGAHLVLTVHRRGGWWPAAGLALTTSALLYTHYYALFLIAVVGAGELWLVLRRHDARARQAFVALAVGAISFTPWLPTLLYQSRHTGAPWQAAPDGNAVLSTIDAWMGGASTFAQVSGLIAVGCVVLALIGRRGGRGQVVLGTKFSVAPTTLLATALGSLVIAIVIDVTGGQAYAPRYLSYGIGLFLVVVACGIAVLPSRRARRGMLAILVVAGLTVCAENAWQPRSQANQVATAIASHAKPGDVVVYCPDQLGPSTSLLLHLKGVRQLVYPNFRGAQIVDWVDYRGRIENSDPLKFSRAVDQLAANHTIWLVWSLQVKPLASDCSGVIDNLLALRGLPSQPVSRDPSFSETMALDVYPARG
jgi:mannosyltransferase